MIAPDGAAGLGDFKAEADRLAAAGLCQFSYFHATFQGEKTNESMKRAFIDAHHCHEATPLDALIIIRGGGSKTDLQWLNELLLAKMVCRFHVPVYTGIGHERDTTILDEYAYQSFGTPSKVIAYIKEVIAARANKAMEDWRYLSQTIQARLSTAEARIEQQFSELGSALHKQVDLAANTADKHFVDVQNTAISKLNIATERVYALHVNVVDSADAQINLAQTGTLNLHNQIKDRTISIIDTIELDACNNFDSVILATRRSIDGINDHLEEYLVGIMSNASTKMNSMSAESDRHLQEVLRYANQFISQAEDKVAQDFDTIVLQSRLRADTASERINGHLQNIISDSTNFSAAVSVETERLYLDIQHYATRKIETAELDSQERIASILAHGVDRTLRRGFAVVNVNGSPISSKAAASTHRDLSITFHDGTINVLRKEE